MSWKIWKKLFTVPLGIDIGREGLVRTFFLVYISIRSPNSNLICSMEDLLGPEDTGDASVAIFEGELDHKQIIQKNKKISGSERSMWKRGENNMTEHSGETTWVVISWCEGDQRPL